MHFTKRTVMLVVLNCTATATLAAVPMDPHDLAGVWWIKTSVARLLPSDGRPLPFTSTGHSRYTANMAGLKSGAIVDEARHVCVPQGMPRALTGAYPLEIMMTPGQVTFAHEENRTYRQVAFSDKHADTKVWDPSYMGDGIAKWDGSTLVVDTTNFKADKIFLDDTGLPASDQLHVVEHIRLVDGGDRLEDHVTIEDPVIFTMPWTVTLTFERRDDIELKTDWVCGERHRDVSAHRAGGAQ